MGGKLFGPAKLRNSVAPSLCVVRQREQRVTGLSRKARASGGNPEIELGISVEVEAVDERAGVVPNGVLEAAFPKSLLKVADVRADECGIEAKVAAAKKDPLDTERFANMVK